MFAATGDLRALTQLLVTGNLHDVSCVDYARERLFAATSSITLDDLNKSNDLNDFLNDSKGETLL